MYTCEFNLSEHCYMGLRKVKEQTLQDVKGLKGWSRVYRLLKIPRRRFFMFRQVYVPRRIMVSLIVGCVWLLSCVPIAIAVGVQPTSVVPHFQHYLALGDSLAYGLQPSTLTTGDHGHGYVDDFSAFLEIRKLVTDHQDLGCPSETTGSFISGGLCHYPPP